MRTPKVRPENGKCAKNQAKGRKNQPFPCENRQFQRLDFWQSELFSVSLKLLSLACGYMFVGILLTQGTKMAQVMSFQTSPGLEISMSYIYAVIPISGSLMLLYLIRDTLRFLKGEDVKNEEVHS